MKFRLPPTFYCYALLTRAPYVGTLTEGKDGTLSTRFYMDFAQFLFSMSVQVPKYY